MQLRKAQFSTIFILLVTMLVSLPFLTTFQDILTRIIMGIQGYRWLQEFIVPYEMRIISMVLTFFGLHIQAGHAYIQFFHNGQREAIYLIWNCVGWQSFIVFLITLITGFSGNFTWQSKVEAFVVGVLGTYIMNILRLILVVSIYYITGRGIGIIFHDYFSGFMSIIWIFVFWWIAYNTILSQKHEAHHVT